MPTCEFRLARKDAVITTEVLPALPDVRDHVIVQGTEYRVAAMPGDISEEPVTIYVEEVKSKNDRANEIGRSGQAAR